MQRLQSGGDAPCRFPTTQWSRVVTAGSRGTTEARECAVEPLPGLLVPHLRVCPAPRTESGAGTGRDPGVLRLHARARRDRNGRSRAGDFGHFSSPSVPATWPPSAIAGMRQNGAERGLCSRSNRSMPNAGTKASQPTYSLPSVSSTARGRLTLLARVVERLRGEYDNADRSDRFQELLAILTRDRASESYADIALRLGITEGNVRVAVHRLRRRYGIVLREEIAATVGDDADIDDEIRSLFAALKVEARK